MCPINQKLECLIYYLFFLHSKGDKMSSNKSILLFCKTAGNSFAKMCVCCLCINFLKKRRNFFSFTLPSFIFLSNWNTLEKFTTSFVKIVG